MNLRVRTRLTLWYMVLLAGILAAAGAFVLVRLQADLIRGIDQSLDSRAATISLGYLGGGEGEFQDVSDSALTALPRGESASQLLASNGSVTETSGDPVAERPMLGVQILSQVGSDRGTRLTVRLGPDREPFRLLAVRQAKAAGEVIVVATSLEEVNTSVHRLLILLLLACPLALAAAGAGGWLVATKALRPVARMTAEAASIGAERLDERVAVPKAADELGRLAQTLNAMLGRIESGVEEKRRFMADASHELRTPLAVMRTEMDVTLRSADLPEEAGQVLRSARDEVERMSQIVENLLTLARLDEGRMELLRRPVDLTDVVATVVNELHPLAESKSIQIEVSGRAPPVEVDRERLSQALSNVVENAVKYSGRGAMVRISVWRRDGEAGVTVADTGPGISPDALPHVFDRFYRASLSRSRAEGGTGLGLAISREILDAHGGRVAVESRPGQGSVFTLAVPLGPRNP